MRRVCIILSTTVMMSLLVSCNSKPQDIDSGSSVVAPVIVIYGSLNCDHCVNFKTKLDSVGLAYVFNDVDVNDAHVETMLSLVQQANYKGRINYPVIHLNERELFIAPEFEHFLGRL